jgi:hypothetical protein
LWLLLNDKNSCCPEIGDVLSLRDAKPDISKYMFLVLLLSFVTVEDIAVGSIAIDVSVLLIICIEILLVILRALKLKMFL